MATIQDVGSWRFEVDGNDVTLFRGVPIEEASWTTTEPFGCQTATLVLPGITPLDTLGVGDLDWCHAGAPVDIWWRAQDGAQTSVYSGELMVEEPSLSDTQGRTRFECVGDMQAASLVNWQPPAGMDPTDIGTVIADALNAVPGRRYGKITRVETGILTTYLGADDQSVVAYCQELLSTAVTSDGTRQWTVRRAGKRAYEIALKNVATVNWTARAGQPGVRFNLSRDASQAPTRIFGSGVTKDGYSWRNMFYPNAFGGSAAPYPFTNAGTTMHLGTTDADTDTGDGVSVLQQRLNDLGYTGDVAVDGVINANDVAAIKVVQRQLGISVDGVVAGQTWTAMFASGGSTGDAARLPLAEVGAGNPATHNADGGLAGVNDAWDSTILTVDKDVNFGGGVSKAQGLRAATAMLARDYPAGYTGNIEWAADPREGSRRLIQAGDNISLLGTQGNDIHLHIASCTVNYAGTTQTTVDQKNRDLLNLVQIIQRNRDNAVNPAGLPKSRFARRALLSGDTVTPFDGESPAGRIPTVPLYGHLWSVVMIPCSQAGRLAKAEFTTSPATKYAMSWFGAPITPAQLNDLIGDPLSQDSPYETRQDDLEGAGWIEGWGSKNDACGLTPAGHLRATWRDNGTLNYRSARPPYIWVAFFAASACRIRGRLYPAPLDG